MRRSPTPLWLQSVLPQRTQGSWLDGPSQPGPTEEELTVLRDRAIAPAKRPLRLEPEVATKLLITGLRDTKYLRVNIQALEPSTKHLFSCAELPFKVFNQLDKEIFRSTLKDNVHLTFAQLPQCYPGMTSRQGLIRPRITIRLSQDLVNRGSHARLLAALLHQMIHAYLLQCCGHRNVGVKAIGYDLSHDHCFSSILYAIQGRFQLPSQFQFPSLWCYDHNGSRNTNWEHELLQEAGSSDCFIHRRRIRERSCERWITDVMDKVSMPSSPLPGENTTTRRNYLGPTTQYLHLIGTEGSTPEPCRRQDYKYRKPNYIELHFAGGAFPVPKDLIQHIPSLQHFLRPSAPTTISIPSNTSDAAFRALYSFLQRGAYDPSLDNPTIIDYIATPAATGPPIIHSHDPTALPLLLTNIRTYRLALALHIPELATHALARLYRQTATSNDPITVLEEIYHPPDHTLPEQELRTWVKDWLMVEIPTGQGGNRKAYATNLAVLKGEWQEGWEGVRERSWGDGVEVEMQMRAREDAAMDTKPPATRKQAERVQRQRERAERGGKAKGRADRDQRDSANAELDPIQRRKPAPVPAPRPQYLRPHAFYTDPPPQAPYEPYPGPYDLPLGHGLGMPFLPYNMGAYQAGGYGGWDRRGRGRCW